MSEFDEKVMTVDVDNHRIYYSGKDLKSFPSETKLVDYDADAIAV
jgi:hypothetical protein